MPKERERERGGGWGGHKTLSTKQGRDGKTLSAKQEEKIKLRTNQEPKRIAFSAKQERKLETLVRQTRNKT